MNLDWVTTLSPFWPLRPIPNWTPIASACNRYGQAFLWPLYRQKSADLVKLLAGRASSVEQEQYLRYPRNKHEQIDYNLTSRPCKIGNCFEYLRFKALQLKTWSPGRACEWSCWYFFLLSTCSFAASGSDRIAEAPDVSWVSDNLKK